MKRILVWFWSNGGGGSQFAAHLAHRLAARFGADAVTLSLRAEDPTIASAEARSLRVLRANVVSDRRRPIDTALSLAGGATELNRHVVASGADVVCLAMNFAAAAPLALTLNKPLVYCAHDPEPHSGDYAALGQRATQVALLLRADTIVALSRFAASQLANHGAARGKGRLAPLASVFEPVAQIAPLQASPVRLLLIGRMIAYKGLALIPGAVQALSARDDWRLNIVGRGPALTHEAQRRLSALPGVSARDAWLTEAETDALIDAHDVVLAPYLDASQSGVVAQALARGRPVVATPVGALPEQLDDGAAGWIATAPTPAAFAEALKHAVEDAEARAAKSLAAHALAHRAWTSADWDWIGEP